MITSFNSFIILWDYYDKQTRKNLTALLQFPALVVVTVLYSVYTPAKKHRYHITYVTAKLFVREMYLMCFRNQENEKIFDESLGGSENVGVLLAVCALTLLSEFNIAHRWDAVGEGINSPKSP